MKKILACVMALALLLAVAGGCSNANKLGQQLAGKWETSLGPFEFKAMEFVSNEDEPLKGKVNLALISNLIDGSYEIIPGEKKDDPDTIKITYTVFSISTTKSYRFTVTDEALTLTGEGNSTSLNYTRPKAEEPGTTA